MRLHIFYEGRVQGVGFRWTVKQTAMGFDVTGSIRNMSDGRVELFAEGERIASSRSRRENLAAAAVRSGPRSPPPEPKRWHRLHWASS